MRYAGTQGVIGHLSGAPHAGPARSWQPRRELKAPTRAGAGLARQQGPQPATSHHHPSPTRKGATAGLSALNAGMPSAPGQPRVLALQCTWSARSCSECAPGHKTLRTSGGQTQNECGAQGRGGATRAWQCRAARQECGRSAAGVRQVGSPQLQPTLAPRTRKYGKNISL